MSFHGFGDVAERLRRATVQVRAGGRGCGSGVVWSADGRIVTNAHVVAAGRPEVELWNGRRVASRVIAEDRGRDLALLQADTAQADTGSPAAAQTGDSSLLRVGELVVAVGNPFGFTGAVSTGTIHSVGTFRGLGARNWVASDVRLAPGNSGGPLANARGELVGVNTMIAGGLAFSIPSNAVAQFVGRAADRHAALGVVVQPVPLDGESGQIGVLVLEIVRDSAAERASLLPGDVLIAVSGRRFRSLDDFENALYASRTGLLEVEFRRGGAARSRSVMVRMAMAARAA